MSNKIEFAKYIDVTQRANTFKISYIADYYKGYDSIYICPDVNDTWVARILKGDDEWIIERDKLQNGDGIALDLQYDEVPNILDIQRILGDNIDDNIISHYLDIVLMVHGQTGDNWDLCECYDKSECIDILKDVYGICDDKYLNVRRATIDELNNEFMKKDNK